MKDNPSILKDLPAIGKALQKAQTMTPDEIISELKKSQLKGRGGAGFPTGLKLDLTRKSPGTKFVVCNADEGEVGTFKDRKLLIEHFDKMLEGMAISAYVIKADKALIYLRWEYRYLAETLQKKVNEFEKFFPELKITMASGAGAYVCGEETALLDSLEGKRGEPRNKPHYPTDRGYMSSPTLISNVETFCCIPHVIYEGADFFASVGTEGSKGPKLFAISGDVEKPGVYEFPLGTSLQTILDHTGAVDTKAALVGGASGILVKKEDFTRKLAYEDLPPGGSIVVINKRRNMLDILGNIIEFFHEESCSQCVPCREGNYHLLNFVQTIKKEGTVSKKELQRYNELAEIMKIACKCGLGQSTPNPYFSIMNNFSEEFLTIKN